MVRPSRQHSRLTDLLPLLEFGKVVNSSLDIKFILGTVVLTLMGKLLLSRGVVLLKTGGKAFRVENVKGVPADLLQREIVFPRIWKKSTPLPKSGSTSVLSKAGIVRLFPIVSHDVVLGFFGIGERQGGKKLAPHEKEFVETLISLSAAAIEKGIVFEELKTVNRTLDEKVYELKTLFELSKEFNAALEREKLLKLFTFTLMGQIGVNRYAIMLQDGNSINSKIDGEQLSAMKNVLFDAVQSPLHVSRLPRGKRFAALHDHCRAAGIVAVVPLQVQNETKGILCLGERFRGGTYSDADLEFIYSLGNLAIISLENARLFREAVEKQRLENELMIAREIQQGLLPGKLPSIEGFESAAVNISSKQVGGDYYDVIPLPNGKYVFAIGDVSGKGTPASLLMANVQAIIRTLVQFNLSLSECTARVNDLLSENTGIDKFITFFWGVLDPPTRVFHYVNAGHNRPFLIRADGTVERLGSGGIILGIMRTMTPYREGKVALHPGDTVVLFTDGISEAMNTAGEDYTEERLERFLGSVHGEPASDILSSVQHEISSYTAGAPQSDDITLLVLRCV